MTGRLEGKVAFVTGIARGQGRSHAVRMAEEGADIIGLDIAEDLASMRRFYPLASEDDLAETVRQVEATGRRIVAVKADVRDFSSIDKCLLEGLQQFGHVDAVVANAGIFMFGDQTHEVTEADWKDVLDINLTGAWLTCKAVIPHLIENGGGSIVLTSSTAGLKGTPNVAPYTASKHAIVGLMRTLALELGPNNIRVNTVHPTAVATDMVFNDALYKLLRPDLEHPTREQAEEVFTMTHALPIAWVESIDISHAVVYLTSDEARYVTGTELKVDGGYTLK